MFGIGDLFNFFFWLVFVENLVLVYFLGMCMFIVVLKNVKIVIGLGVVVIVV